MKIILTAGGTGGHIFPGLAVALEMRSLEPGLSLLWIGTRRSRESELCARHDIPIELLDVTGMRRRVGLSTVKALWQSARGVFRAMAVLRRERPAAVVAFGGYVCAPVLAAAALSRTPFYLQEQNSMPGLVNRVFSRRARCTYLGFPLGEGRHLAGPCRLTGMPVRRPAPSYAGFGYPAGLDTTKTTLLISGGSQGAQSMSRALVGPVKGWLDKGIQVVWQTGAPAYDEIVTALGGRGPVFIFTTIDDIYPYLAIASVAIGRGGASTLAEAALFGVPIISIPLPWSAENHQWINAGLAQEQGWCIRVKQDAELGREVEAAVTRVVGDEQVRAAMRQTAREHSPGEAAAGIASHIISELRS